MGLTVDGSQIALLGRELGALALDPGLLLPTMHRLSRAARAEGSVLLQSDTRTPDVPRTASIDAMIRQYFAESWHVGDRRLGAIPKMIATGVGVDQDFATREMLSRDPYYAELMAAHGLRWWAGIRINVGDAIWCMALQRTPGQGMFEPQDERALAMLCGPLSHAAELSAALGRSRVAAAVDALDLVEEAALVMDRHGAILRHNRAASALLNADLDIVGRTLVTTDPIASKSLAALADRVRAMPPGLEARLPPIPVHRRGRAPLRIEGLTLPPSIAEVFSGARVLFLLRPASVRADADPITTFAAVYRLSSAEAALVEALMSGRTLGEHADGVGITRNTARNQLSSVFGKTGTRRQAELIALVARAASAGDTRR